ncbi:MAG: nodulation protein NfeD [Chloroflexota bacterium]|nr:nodulation protein NfeD [Chloroflexia bacterium]MDQ3443848.1 nodulation protein NfeD [Chloroflexota bacterium]
MTSYLPTQSMPIVFRLWAVISLLAGLLLLAISPLAAQSDSPQVRIITIDDTITPTMAQYVERGIRSAENANADAIVLEIDTPGGLGSAMDDIDRAILESEVPVIAYVSPRGARAASAGVFITYASHIAAMAPGTSIGSASPVSGDGSEMSDTMEAKVTNDAVSTIRNLAELHGRNAEWAESAVRDAANITATEALDLNVINLIAPDLDTLLNDAHGMQATMASGETVTLNTAGAETSTTSMNLIERFLQMISDPTIAYLLLSFGALGIFLELGNPGGFVPGIVGVVSLVLGLYALGTLPVNWTGVALIVIAFALFFIDIFVASFGLLLIGGLASFIIGSYMLVDSSVPGYGNVSRFVIWTCAALILACALIIGTAALRVLRKKPASGRSSLIGDVGVVRQMLDPTGLVFLQGEFWTATAEGEPTVPVPVGAHVEVKEVHGLRLIVKTTSGPETGVSFVNAPRGQSVIPVVGGVQHARLAETNVLDRP